MAANDRSDIEDVSRESETDVAGEAGGHESAEARARREARRRILTGGLAGAPLILTLTSRPAFASHCTISGMDSANLSTTHDILCVGKTPGYWKTHEQQVSAQGIFVGTCNPITDDNGQCDDYSVPKKEDLEAYIEQLKAENKSRNNVKIAAAEHYLEKLDTYPYPTDFFGTLFSEIFNGVYTTNPYTTMMQALWLDDTPPGPPEGMGGPSPVLAHSAAAWLNATEFGKERYGLTPDEVVDLVQTMILSDAYGLKDTLEMLNSRS